MDTVGARRARLDCPLCGSARARVLARPDPWTYVRCDACGSYFVDPMPAGDAVDDADAAYEDAYYGAAAPRENEALFEQATARTSAARAIMLEAELGRIGRLLDVGCGTGYLLAAAKERGWAVAGVEVSAAAARFARETHGVDVATGTLADAMLADASFDAVSLVHVLEHVPDPIGLLREVRRIVDPHGIVAIAIPNPRALIYSAYNLVHRARGRLGRDKYSCSLFPPWHLYAWDVPALTALLARTGFRATNVVVTGKGDPVRYPVVSWKNAGRLPAAQHAIERVGRATGRGSLIECIARPA